jgi:sulfoxide reductase heme-binding subunit YedZ
MTTQAWWYLARASGYVAWGLVSSSVIAGLLLTTRLTNRRPRPAWILDLHRFLAGTAVIFTALHIGGLVADTYVHFGPADILVPLASHWRPAPVALGIIALYLLGAIEITSLLMRRLPRRLWHGVHLTSYVLFWLATFHLLTAGTDATNPLSRLVVGCVVALVTLLTFLRLSDRPSPRPSSARRTRFVSPHTSNFDQCGDTNLEPRPGEASSDREPVELGLRTASHQ